MFKSTSTAQGPAYTVRLLLGTVSSSSGATTKLKPFTHFTLACTSDDQTKKISESIETLAKDLGQPLSLKGEAVVNLGTESSPLWAIKLDLGAQEKKLRATLGKLFDSSMCPERNGTTYLWEATTGQSETKCPHITLGPKQEDYELAKKMIEGSCVFTFDQVDYKKVGPHDPHFSKSLPVRNNDEDKDSSSEEQVSSFSTAAGSSSSMGSATNSTQNFTLFNSKTIENTNKVASDANVTSDQASSPNPIG